MEDRKDEILAQMEANLQSLYIAANEFQGPSHAYRFLLGRIDALNASIAEHISKSQLKKYDGYTVKEAA